MKQWRASPVSAYLPVGGVLLVMAIFIVTGFVSIDYGTHPDEYKLIESVHRSFVTGLFLPGWYNYPSLSYTIALTAALLNPEWLLHLPDAATYLAERTAAPEFAFYTRRVFLLFAAITVAWVYGIIYCWRKSWVEALVGAALFAFSWEVTYHARWIAPDTLLLQFGSLAIFCLFMARRGDRALLWLNLAVVAVALACAAKYTAWALLIPWVIGVWTAPRLDRAQRSWQICRGIALFALTVFVVSPGNFLDLYRAIGDLRAEDNHYRMGHNVYTAQAGLPHFLQIGSYLLNAALSPYRVIAIVFFGYALIGLLGIVRERRYETLLFLSFPVVYLVFISAYQVMFVRNLLICLPFLIILAARGVVLLAQLARTPPLKAALIAIPALLVGANLYWTITTALAIGARADTAAPSRALVQFVERHPDRQFWATAAVRERIAHDGVAAPPNLTGEPRLADEVIFLAAEVDRFPANRFGYLTAWFGTKEVNYPYYPSSIGDRGRRIAVIQAPKADLICASPYPHQLQPFCAGRTGR